MDLQKLQQYLTFANCLVSVDTNTLSWFRSTFSALVKNLNLKMVYVPNYVDLSLFNNKQQTKESGSINIIYPRRCCEERGFYVMAEIIPKILNKYSNVTFNLVGYPHTKDIEKIINDLIAQYPNNVKHQVADAEKMVELYQQVDITIIPTLYCEGTSLSCIEAMACGNTIITTDIGGLPNLIINNYNGILAEPTLESINESLEKVITDSKFRNSLSQKALDVANAFSKNEWETKWKKILGKYLN